MAIQYLEVDPDDKGFDRLLFFLDRLPERGRRKLHGLVDRLGTFSAYWMRIYHGPHVDSGYTMRHIARGAVVWRPGGPGGGGTWEVTSGVKAGESFHPVYHHQGTGIYVGRGVIRPRQPGGVLVWQHGGRPKQFAAWTRGQKPHPFVYGAYQTTKLYAQGQLAVLGQELLHI